MPTQESILVSYNFNINSVPAGEYTITMFTDLNSDTDIPDTNTGNNSKTIKIYIGGITVQPETTQTVNAGAVSNVLLTVSNTAGVNDRFDIELSEVSKQWTTYIINTADGITLAADTNGDSIWDYVNSSYDTDSNSKPDIQVNNNSNYGITFRKLVPDTAEPGEIDITKIKLS